MPKIAWTDKEIIKFVFFFGWVSPLLSIIFGIEDWISYTKESSFLSDKEKKNTHIFHHLAMAI